MKKGDRVYVNWPTGRSGPYEITHDLNTGYEMEVNGQWCEIPQKWCEPAEPEIEEGRLVYTDGDKVRKYIILAQGLAVDDKGIMNNPFHMVQDGEDGYRNAARKVKPVHRRWDELSEDEKKHFERIIDYYNASYKNVFQKAYKLITGEEHP